MGGVGQPYEIDGMKLGRKRKSGKGRSGTNLGGIIIAGTDRKYMRLTLIPSTGRGSESTQDLFTSAILWTHEGCIIFSGIISGTYLILV